MWIFDVLKRGCVSFNTRDSGTKRRLSSGRVKQTHQAFPFFRSLEMPLHAYFFFFFNVQVLKHKRVSTSVERTSMPMILKANCAFVIRSCDFIGSFVDQFDDRSIYRAISIAIRFFIPHTSHFRFSRPFFLTVVHNRIFVLFPRSFLLSPCCSFFFFLSWSFHLRSTSLPFVRCQLLLLSLFFAIEILFEQTPATRHSQFLNVKAFVSLLKKRLFIEVIPYIVYRVYTYICVYIVSKQKIVH